jgi:hypothetical protein
MGKFQVIYIHLDFFYCIIQETIFFYPGFENLNFLLISVYCNISATSEYFLVKFSVLTHEDIKQLLAILKYNFGCITERDVIFIILIAQLGC